MRIFAADFEAGNGQAGVQVAIQIAAYQPRPQICLWNQFKLAQKPLSFLCPFLDLMVSGENRNYPFMSI